MIDKRVELLTELIVGDSKRALEELDGMLPLFKNIPSEKYTMIRDRVNWSLTNLLELIPLWLKLKS